MSKDRKNNSNIELLKRNLYTLRAYRGLARLEDMISNAGDWRRDFYRGTCKIGRLADLAQEVRMPMYTLFKERFARHIETKFVDEQLAINPTVNRLIRQAANLCAMKDEAARLGVTLSEMLHPGFTEE
jgi:hypothetical protein